MIVEALDSPAVDRKTRALAATILRCRLASEAIDRILVVGCGNGSEARDLARIFNSRVDAIDIEDRFAAPHRDVRFHRMDAQQMTFADASFDLVYSFHALEHMPNPQQAIAEIRRVLRAGCMFVIGVPNRHRLLGYIGGRDTSFSQKIAWNLNDWRQRLRGRFRNEFGAHAGFTGAELQALCAPIGAATPANRVYYDAVYPWLRVPHLIAGLLGVSGLLLPSVYVIGRKS
jgi:SAM-dependent methyltransferase